MNVYFTVDTECSMNGAWADMKRRPLAADRNIFCRIDNKDYGVGLITRILQEHRFRATYFVETLATLVKGEGEIREVFDYLLSQNQDVQLHLHPVYRFYADVVNVRPEGQHCVRGIHCDFLGRFERSVQSELLGEAADFYFRFVGRGPKAFRSGCYSATDLTLTCLRELGICFDTSYNPCYPDQSFPGQALEPNAVVKINGVWEIPITVARTTGAGGRSRWKFADPSAISVLELRAMLEAGERWGQKHFVIVFHSFSAVKARDIAYTSMRANRLVIRRLYELMDYLATNRDRYNVCTFDDLAADHALAGAAPIAKLGWGEVLLRKSVQAVNRLYWI